MEELLGWRPWLLVPWAGDRMEVMGWMAASPMGAGGMEVMAASPMSILPLHVWIQTHAIFFFPWDSHLLPQRDDGCNPLSF